MVSNNFKQVILPIYELIRKGLISKNIIILRYMQHITMIWLKTGWGWAKLSSVMTSMGMYYAPVVVRYNLIFGPTGIFCFQLGWNIVPELTKQTFRLYSYRLTSLLFIILLNLASENFWHTNRQTERQTQ